MRQSIDPVPSALAAHPASSLAELIRRLAIAGLLLAALTALASIALTVQS